MASNTQPTFQQAPSVQLQSNPPISTRPNYVYAQPQAPLTIQPNFTSQSFPTVPSSRLIQNAYAPIVNASSILAQPQQQTGYINYSPQMVQAQVQMQRFNPMVQPMSSSDAHLRHHLQQQQLLHQMYATGQSAMPRPIFVAKKSSAGRRNVQAPNEPPQQDRFRDDVLASVQSYNDLNNL